MKLDQNRIELKVQNSIYDEGVFVLADGTTPKLFAGTLVALGLPSGVAKEDAVSKRKYLRTPDETVLIGSSTAGDVADICAFEPAIILENALLGLSINHRSDRYTRPVDVVDELTGQVTRRNEHMSEHLLARRVVNADVYLIRAMEGDYRAGDAVYAIQTDNGIYVTKDEYRGGMRIGWAQEDYEITSDMMDLEDDSNEERPSTLNLNGKFVNLLKVRIGLKGVPRGATASTVGSPTQNGASDLWDGVGSPTTSVEIPLSNALSDDVSNGVSSSDFSVNVLEPSAGADESSPAANVVGASVQGRLLVLSIDPGVNDAVNGILVCSNEALSDLTGVTFPVFPHGFSASADGSLSSATSEITFRFDDDSILLTKDNLVYDESLIELGDLIRDAQDGSIYRVSVTPKFSGYAKSVSIGIELPGVSRRVKDVFVSNGNSIESAIYSVDENDPSKVTLVITTTAPVAYNAAMPEITANDFVFSDDVESVDGFFVEDKDGATQITINMTMGSGAETDEDGSFRDPFARMNEQLKQLLAKEQESAVVENKLRVNIDGQSRDIYYEVEPVINPERPNDPTTCLKVIFSLFPNGSHGGIRWSNAITLDGVISKNDFYILYGSAPELGMPSSISKPSVDTEDWERRYGTLHVRSIKKVSGDKPNEWYVYLNNNLTNTAPSMLLPVRLVCSVATPSFVYANTGSVGVRAVGSDLAYYWIIPEINSKSYQLVGSNKLYDAKTEKLIKHISSVDEDFSLEHPFVYSEYTMSLYTDVKLTNAMVKNIAVMDRSSGVELTSAKPVKSGKFDVDAITNIDGTYDISTWYLAVTVDVVDGPYNAIVHDADNLYVRSYGGFVPCILAEGKKGSFAGYRYKLKIRVYAATGGVSFPVRGDGWTVGCRLGISNADGFRFREGRYCMMDASAYDGKYTDIEDIAYWCAEKYHRQGVDAYLVKYILDNEYAYLVGDYLFWSAGFPLTVAGVVKKNSQL